MNAKKRIRICITALIPTLVTVVPDFGLFYAFIRVTAAVIEKQNRLLSLFAVMLLFLNGLLFPAAERVTWRIFRKTWVPEKKELHIALLIGAVVYALVTAFLFPKSMDPLFVYLPKSELSPGLSLLFFQLFSYAAAALCVIVNALGLCPEKRRT